MADNYNTNGLFGARDELVNRGYTNIQYDDKSKNFTADKNGTTYGFNASGLTNQDGHYYGTQEQINNLFANPFVGVRDQAVANGINVGVDQYNNPILNGQSIDTSGMLLINGNWYANPTAVKKQMNGVKPQEFQSNYQKVQQNILNDLLDYANGGFEYDPAKDEALKKAQSDSVKLARQQAYDMGRGNTSYMDYQTQKLADDLAYQYRDKAYQEYLDRQNYLKDLYGLAREGYRDDLDVYTTMRDFRNQDADRTNLENYRGQKLALDTRAQDWNEYADRENWKRNDYQFEAERADRNNQFEREFELMLDKFEEDKRKNLSAEGQKAFDRGLQLAMLTGYIPEAYADILGLPAGMQTLEALERYAQIENYRASTAAHYASANNSNANAAYHNARTVKVINETKKNADDDEDDPFA